MDIPEISVLLTIITLILAGSMIFARAFYVGTSLREEKTKLEKTKEERFQEVLNSDDLATVGKYIDEVIGKFNVHEYVNNPDVSNRVDTYLNKKKSFVWTDTEIERQIDETKRPTKALRRGSLIGELDKVVSELRTGEKWNALARLRRHIEMSLREIAAKKDLVSEGRLSAGQLLNLLLRHEIITKSTFLDLKYAVTICNRAVHGEDVSIGESEEAVYYANRGLKVLYGMIDRKAQND